MNALMLLTDANTLAGVFTSLTDTFFGGDWILIGLAVFILVAVVLALTKVRSGGVVVVGVGFAYLLTLFNPAFQVVFWLGIVTGVFMLVMGMRRTTTQ